jgi:hypothetical protein
MRTRARSGCRGVSAFPRTAGVFRDVHVIQRDAQLREAAGGAAEGGQREAGGARGVHFGAAAPLHRLRFRQQGRLRRLRAGGALQQAGERLAALRVRGAVVLRSAELKLVS